MADLYLMDTRSYKREAWNRQIEKENLHTIPASTREIAAAKEGNWEIRLTPSKPVPMEYHWNLGIP